MFQIIMKRYWYLRIIMFNENKKVRLNKIKLI